jgi:hypothetical protein
MEPSGDFFHVDTPESNRRQQIYNSIRPKLLAGDFEGLEEGAQSLRDSRETFFHGSWALTSFYLAVADIDYELSDQECVAHLNKIRAWVAAQPNSVTARIALAHALTDYAWKARGTDWGDKVTADGSQLMDERLAEAWRVLEEAKKLPNKCPAWWTTAQNVALGQGWDKSRYLELLNEAIAFEPSYIDFYDRAVLYFQPRWYGEEGEASQFMNDQANRYPGVEGNVFYARLIWLLDLRRLDKNIYHADSGLSWSRTTAGFEELLRRYPESLSVQSEFARLCFKTKDKNRAQPLYQKIGLLMDNRIWFNEDDTFTVYRNWALR